jgi:hypothetical protein
MQQYTVYCMGSNLLRLASLHRKEQTCCIYRISHIYGDNNRLADDASWQWDLNDEALLTYFDSTYPQTRSWQLCPLLEKASELRDGLHDMPAEIANGVCPMRVV